MRRRTKNAPPATESANRRSHQRLVRTSPHYLKIEGLRCGIQKPWEKQPCGGELLVEDWHPKGVRGQWRYEIFCAKCKTCDCDGWARQDELLPNAREYFHALDSANAELSDSRLL